MAGRGAGGDRPDGLGGVRDPGVLPPVEYRAGVLRQQAVPRVARPAGVERAERGAGAPDGVVRRYADGAVVCGRWPCRCACGEGPPLVCPEGGADVQRHAGCAAVADVAASGLWGVWPRGTLTGMRRNAAPDALRSGVGSERQVRRPPLRGRADVSHLTDLFETVPRWGTPDLDPLAGGAHL